MGLFFYRKIEKCVFCSNFSRRSTARQSLPVSDFGLGSIICLGEGLQIGPGQAVRLVTESTVPCRGQDRFGARFGVDLKNEP